MLIVPPGLYSHDLDYTTTGSNYDGTGDYANRTADLTGIANAKEFTVSVWVKIGASAGTGTILTCDTTANPFRWYIAYISSEFVVLARNAAGTTILEMQSATTYDSTDGWLWVAASVDMADNTKRHLYVDGVDDLDSTPSTHTDDTIEFAAGDFYVGNDENNGSNYFKGDMSELYFHSGAGTYRDLSALSMRDKFFAANDSKPRNLSSNGSVPLGVQPLLYAPDGDPSTNAGSGGNLTLTGGGLSASSTNPSD